MPWIRPGGPEPSEDKIFFSGGQQACRTFKEKTNEKSNFIDDRIDGHVRPERLQL